jgi:hypothetical protein
MNRDNEPALGVILLQSIGLVFAQLLDFGTTMLGLKNGAEEANGFIRMIIEDYGTSGFLVTKLLFGFGFAWFCRYRPAAAWGVTLLTCGVALWNLRVLYLLG